MGKGIIKEADATANVDRLLDDIKNIISVEVEKLKRQILSSPIPKRSYFDYLKNWWNNLTHGHDASTNPYFHKNRLGALGYTEQYDKINELEILKESALALDEAVGTTKFEKMLDTWSATLKTKLSKFVGKCIKQGKCDIEDVTEPDKPEEREDEAPPPPGPTTTTTPAPSASTTTTTTPLPSVTTTTTPIPSVTTTTTLAPSPSASTTTTPVVDSSIIDFELFAPKLSEKQKEQAAKHFEPYLSLSEDEKKKLNEKGNYYLGIQPSGTLKYVVDGIDLDLPFFLSKEDPRWNVIHDYYNTTFNQLTKQKRIQAPRSGGWADGLKLALLNALQVPETKGKITARSSAKNMISLFVSKIIEMIQRQPEKYYDEYLPIIKLMIKNKDDLAYKGSHDDDTMNWMASLIENLPDEESYQQLKAAIIHAIHNVNYPDNEGPETNLEWHNPEGKLKTYMVEKVRKIKLDKESTLYERTLDCLEKLRNIGLILD